MNESKILKEFLFRTGNENLEVKEIENLWKICCDRKTFNSNTNENKSNSLLKLKALEKLIELQTNDQNISKVLHFLV